MIVTFKSCVVMMVILGASGTLPSAPSSFSLEARNEIGRFDIKSAAASQSAPENGLFAFIFKVETVDEIAYVLQVRRVRYFNALLLLVIILICSQA